MIKNIFFIIIGFLLGVFLTSSLSWRDVDFQNLKQSPWQELMRLRGIITERPRPESNFLVVTKILDGDSVLVEGGKEVRLLGIDADEEGEPCYEESKQKLQELVLGKKTTMVKDINDKDEQGRLLRYLKIDNLNINVELVKEGLVSLRIIDNVTLYKNDLIFAEQYAKNKGIGCKWTK
jgi:endonuclease YncB( thermonuclease family)